MLFKNVIITIVLFLLGFIKFTYTSECVTIFGPNNFSIILARNIVQSIPQFAAHLTNARNNQDIISVNHMNQEQLDFLNMYATKRFLLKSRQAQEVVEENLESFISNMSLQTLALHTVAIGSLYQEPIPQGFDQAWRNRLKTVGRADVEELIEDERLVKILYDVCWSEPSIPIVDSLFPQSTSSYQSQQSAATFKSYNSVNSLDLQITDSVKTYTEPVGRLQPSSYHHTHTIMKAAVITFMLGLAIYNKNKFFSCFEYIKESTCSIMHYILDSLLARGSSIVIGNNTNITS